MDPWAWSWNPEALVAVALALVSLAAQPRLEWWRRVAFLAGCGLVALALASPLDTLAREYLVLAHLIQNVALAELAPLLLVLGLSPALAERLSGAPAVGLVTHPLVALPAWLGVYAVWHVPAVYDAALRHPHWLLPIEHATYLLSGLCLWWCVWQGAPHALRPGARSGYAFAAFVLSAPLGLLLALVPEPLYEYYAAAPERVWGLSRLEDQQLGGMTMAAEQSLVFFGVCTFWFLRFLVEQEALDDEPPGGRR